MPMDVFEAVEFAHRLPLVSRQAGRCQNRPRSHHARRPRRVRRQSAVVAGLCARRRAACRAQAQGRGPYRRPRSAPRRCRISDLPEDHVGAVQVAPRGARRAALRRARRRARRCRGAARAIQAQFRILQRAGRAVHRHRPQARSRPMGRSRRLYPRAWRSSPAATASIPARRNPGPACTASSASSSKCRRSRCCSAPWRSATATTGIRRTVFARRAPSLRSSASFLVSSEPLAPSFARKAAL